MEIVAYVQDAIDHLGNDNLRAKTYAAMAVFVSGKYQVQYVEHSLNIAVQLEYEILDTIVSHFAKNGLVHQVLDIIRKFENPRASIEILYCLIPHLPASLFSQILNYVHSVDNAEVQVYVPLLLGTFLPHLPIACKTEALLQSLDNLYSLNDEAQYTEILTAICVNISDDIENEVVNKILEIAAEITETGNRMRIWSACTAYLPVPLWKKALSCLPSAEFPYISDYAEAFIDLIKYGPANVEVEPEIIAQSVDIFINSIKQSCLYADIASDLIVYSPEDVRLETVSQILSRVNGGNDDHCKIKALAVLFSYAPEKNKSGILDQVLGFVIEKAKYRKEILTLIVQHFDTTDWIKAMNMIRDIKRNSTRAEFMIDLIQFLPQNLEPEIVNFARSVILTIDHRYYQATCWAVLSSHLENTEKTKAISKALDIAFSIGISEGLHGPVPTLQAIAPYLPISLWCRVLQTVIDFNDYDRARVLVAVIPHLPAGILPQVMKLAHDIEIDYRMGILAAIARRLSSEVSDELLSLRKELFIAVLDSLSIGLTKSRDFLLEFILGEDIFIYLLKDDRAVARIALSCLDICTKWHWIID
jgi:hypothetical protein